MAICPFAKQKLIAPGANDPKITPRMAILHVDAGGADSLFDYFRDRSGGVESHFYIKWDGTIEQYRDTAYQADANFEANDFAVSIETQGFPNGKWNKRQMRSIKRLLLWLEAEHSIPLHKVHAPRGEGVGYHTLFGSPSPWTPVAKSCPGPNRIIQFNKELVPWMRAVTAPPVPKERVTLSVITANVYKNNVAIDKDLAVLAATKAHVIGLNEAGRWVDMVSNLDGYRAIYGMEVDDTRLSRTNPILIREDLKVLGQGIQIISEEIGGAPFRTAVYVKFELDGQLRAHVNLHANNLVQLNENQVKPRTLPRVKEFVRSMQLLSSLVKGLEAEGYKVTIGGDFNWSWSRRVDQWLWTPQRVLGALGYKTQFEHRTRLPRPKRDKREIEYVFYHPDDLVLLSQNFVTPEHSDHPYHQVTFIVKER